MNKNELKIKDLILNSLLDYNEKIKDYCKNIYYINKNKDKRLECDNSGYRFVDKNDYKNNIKKYNFLKNMIIEIDEYKNIIVYFKNIDNFYVLHHMTQLKTWGNKDIKYILFWLTEDDYFTNIEYNENNEDLDYLYFIAESDLALLCA